MSTTTALETGKIQPRLKAKYNAEINPTGTKDERKPDAALDFDSTNAGGVYVIDAKEPGDIRAMLGDGPWVVDGWWSDMLVEKVPRVPIE